jgi:hypothetical protein
MSDQPSNPPESITCQNCGTAQLPGPFCTNCGALLPTQGSPTPAPHMPPVSPVGGYSTGEPPKPPYPVSLDFSGPEQLSRLSTFFRLVLAIPLFFFLAVIGWAGSGVLSGLVAAHWLSLLVRKGRPVGWIGSAIVAILRFYFRAYAYLLLITDKYPAFEGDWYLQLDVQRPERVQRRQIFFWKTIAVIPHLVCLTVLWFAVAVCVVIAWFAILFTGRFPRGLRDFVVGYMRWWARVLSYWFSLRDEFPPYSLSAEASAGSRAATGFSALGGVVAAVAIGAGIGAAYLALSEPETARVSYEQLLAARESPALIVDNVEVQISSVDDDYDFPGQLLVPDRDSRFVLVNVGIFNIRTHDIEIFRGDFQLRDDSGDKNDPVFVSVGGVAAPAFVDSGEFSEVLLVFKIDKGAKPTEFRYGPENSLRDAKFVFD